MPHHDIEDYDKTTRYIFYGAIVIIGALILIVGISYFFYDLIIGDENKWSKLTN